MSFAPLLGRIPSGLFVLTVRSGELDGGMLASWVMQAGFEPPMVTVAVRKDRYLADWLSAGSPAVLHCLKADDKTLLKHFARGFEPGGPMLEGLPHRRSAQGVAIVAGSLGHLELTPKGHVDSGDHRIFLAEVTGGSLEADEPPAVHIRKNGLNY